MKLVIGITGSSGSIYAVEFLKRTTANKYLIVTKWGKVVLQDETGESENTLKPFVKRIFKDDDLTAPPASGSNKFDAFVILPASTSTIGKIASGLGDTLITRTAQVCLKERYKLIICVRETPLATNTLEQLTKLSSYGAVIMPISPPLYFVPKTVDEYIHSFVDKLHGVLGIGEQKGWRAEEFE
ncbi:MAG: UbiX family flavin prenyltransferase [Bacteroidetes bacterium]|nr:UbiX family flavin prenyltransferase [Bacteroidota bacterium]MBU2585848.1 UbiX family flavin prenyltransferase [Bacteroidota bacterium]